MAATSNDNEWNKLNEGWPRRYKAFKYGGGSAVTEWKLDSVPARGTLYEGAAVLAAGDTVSDPDELYFSPDLGFEGHDRFSYCASDSSGQSATAEIKLNVVSSADYPMPIGIPDPGFGIAEEPPADPGG